MERNLQKQGEDCDITNITKVFICHVQCVKLTPVILYDDIVLLLFFFLTTQADANYILSYERIRENNGCISIQTVFSPHLHIPDINSSHLFDCT